jgi:hypothetical protein
MLDLTDRDARIIRAQERAGIDFLKDSRKALPGNEKTLPGKCLYPRRKAEP